MAFPAGIIFQVNLADAFLHPVNPWIYLITKSDTWSKNSVIVYNYATDEMVKEIELPFTPGQSVVADNGNGLQLYIPGADGRIYIYSPEDLSLIKSIPTRHPCLSVDVNGSGIILTGESLDDWVTANPVRTYSQSTGELIDSAGTAAATIIKKVPGKVNTFISVSTYVSPSEMEYYRIDNNGKFVLSTKDIYHGDYQLTANKFDISPNGEYVISYNEVYYADSAMLHMGRIGHTVTGVAFNNDGSKIYAGSYNEQLIRTDDYPALTVSSQIATKGYVSNLFVRDNQLISLSLAPEGYNVYFVEIKDLP